MSNANKIDSPESEQESKSWGGNDYHGSEGVKPYDSNAAISTDYNELYTKTKYIPPYFLHQDTDILHGSNDENFTIKVGSNTYPVHRLIDDSEIFYYRNENAEPNKRFIRIFDNNQLIEP